MSNTDPVLLLMHALSGVGLNASQLADAVAHAGEIRRHRFDSLLAMKNSLLAHHRMGDPFPDSADEDLKRLGDAAKGPPIEHVKQMRDELEKWIKIAREALPPVTARLQAASPGLAVKVSADLNGAASATRSAVVFAWPSNAEGRELVDELKSVAAMTRRTADEVVSVLGIAPADQVAESEDLPQVFLPPGWFAKATTDLLNADLLRKAAQRKTIVGKRTRVRSSKSTNATSKGGRTYKWEYRLDSMADEYRQYRLKILRAWQADGTAQNRKEKPT